MLARFPTLNLEDKLRKLEWFRKMFLWHRCKLEVGHRCYRACLLIRLSHLKTFKISEHDFHQPRLR
jgi:hypothetical protein